MDDLEVAFRQLLHVIRTRYPEYLERPFDVAELHQTILPYRHYKRELGLQSNDAYELVMLRLLSGAGGYLTVGDRMRDTLTRELAAPSPDASAFRQFAAEAVSLSADAIRRADGTGRPSSGTGDASIAGGRGRPALSGPTCRYCDGSLPAGRAVTFCPHCGQNLSIINCPACNAELQADWKFCTVCGRATGSGE